MKSWTILLGLARAWVICSWAMTVPVSDAAQPKLESGASDESPAGAGSLEPIAVQLVDDGRQVLVVGAAGRRAHLIDRVSGRRVRTIGLPAAATGLAVRDVTAYVTTCEPADRVIVLDLARARIQEEIRVGHSPMAPVLDPQGRMLYVANRFDNTVTLLDLASKSQHAIEVIREPIALALSHDGKRLFVANHLPQVRPFLDDENPFIAAEVSVIDTQKRRLLRNIELPNGSQGLRGIALSPDGQHVVVTHILGHYTVPPWQIENGAMNMNALSLVDARTLEWIETVMLDDPSHGAANPWAAAFSGRGDRLFVTHAGTHELSVIDFPSLLERVFAGAGASGLYDERNLLTMRGIRQRVRLPVIGPRALCESEGLVYVPGYFSGDLAVVDLRSSKPAVHCLALEEPSEPSLIRQGERYFNDASLCWQQWQSCSTCHPDGRSDVLYWDLLNDGLGNTKNTKSLLMSALTPPVMWRGVRADAGMAVRAGIHHIQFVEPKAEQARAIEAYLAAMKATPSPHLNADVLETPKTDEASCGKCHYPGVPRGTLTESARRGKGIFEGKGQCATCHPHPTFTAMLAVDPGLGASVHYDIPSLVEVWRTAPYLHNGDALSLRETITDFNFMQRRGRTSQLSEAELNDLVEYLKSL